MLIDTPSDGGSIRVVDASDLSAVELALRPDTAADFMQWFHFRVRGALGHRCQYRIGNAGEATFGGAFEGYRACASYDGERWFRVPTTFDGEALTIRHIPEHDEILYAYFATYPLERHQWLLSETERSERARVEQLGVSVEGRPMSLVTVGEEEPENLRIWVIARQHPGETMAEWFMEGLIDRLLKEDDSLARAILERAVVYLVPTMNPDGGVLGNQRTNAAGQDLNRAWTSPTRELSPEVLLVRDALEDRGVDLFLDVHGDESTPYVFAAGCEGNPGYTERLDALEDLFMESLARLDESFQRRYGYALDPPGEADLSTAANYVGEQFDCLSLTLEMPFKDDADHPNEKVGWSPERARELGRSVLESIFVCLDTLR